MELNVLNDIRERLTGLVRLVLRQNVRIAAIEKSRHDDKENWDAWRKRVDWQLRGVQFTSLTGATGAIVSLVKTGHDVGWW